MADLRVVVAAVAAAAGARWALPVPWWVGAAAAGLALWRRWPAVLCVAVLLLAARAGPPVPGRRHAAADRARGGRGDPPRRSGRQVRGGPGHGPAGTGARRALGPTRRGRPASPPTGGRAAHHQRPDRAPVTGDRGAAGPPARAGPGARRHGDGLVTRRRRQHGREPASGAPSRTAPTCCPAPTGPCSSASCWATTAASPPRSL